MALNLEHSIELQDLTFTLDETVEVPFTNISPIEGGNPCNDFEQEQRGANVAHEDSFLISKDMKFDSMDDVENYYKSFAKQRGFGIRKRSTRSKEKGSNVKISCTWVCHRAGLRPLKNPAVGIKEQLENVVVGKLSVLEKKQKRARSTYAYGCHAGLTATYHENKNKWIIISFSNEHNHNMVSPRSVGLIRCHRRVTSAVKCLVETFEKCRVPTGLVAGMFGGPDAHVTERDCWNHLRNLRLKNLDIGDAEAVLRYCRRKQAENPNFFYSIQPDNEDRMVNFLWIDARARQYYEYFGDVISFDTTYKTNKYNMPFALFIGVNHHGQSIVLGCALLQDESEYTFTWLFETWLEAMSGEAPKTILTDQDHAMALAIATVFPNSRHRLCIWHITSKFPSKLKLYSDESRFGKDMSECIWKSVTKKEFKARWNSIKEKYKLEDNDWFNGLFEIRKSWIPVYNRDSFSAGMNTTQRSESMNSFFDAYFNKNTNLNEFVGKYDEAIESRYEQERKEDYYSRHLFPIMRLHSVMEKQAATVYTRTVFNWFWDELVKKDNFIKNKLDKDGSVVRYEVSNCMNHEEAFLVSLNLETFRGECQCHLFENKGILCWHMLAVLHSKGVREIPAHYILHRWTKDANSDIQYPVNYHKENNLSKAVRSMHVSRCLNYLSGATATSEEAYHKIMNTLLPLWKQIAAMNIEEAVVNQPSEDVQNQLEPTDVAHLILETVLHDPPVCQTKGRPKGLSKNGRFMNSLEVATGRVVKTRKCTVCKKEGHDKRNCLHLKVTTSVVDKN